MTSAPTIPGLDNPPTKHAKLVAWVREIAVVDAPELAGVARLATSPGAVVVTGGSSPLLTDRPSGAAYVCQGFVCDAPTTDAGELARRVKAVLANVN